MSTVVSYAPTNIVSNAMFNFDVFAIANFKLSGVVNISVSDSFTYSQFLVTSPAISSFVYTALVSGNGNWTPTQIANIEQLANGYSNFIDLSFSNVANYSGLTPGAVGSKSDINISLISRADLRISGISAAGSDATFGYSGSNGDVVLNVNGLGVFGQSNDVSLNFSSFGFHTLMHEMGHSLGLSHPHSDYVNGVPTITPEYALTTTLGFDRLGFRINSPLDMYKEYFSIMSYDDQKPAGLPDTFAQTPMILDVLALQTAYGEGRGSSSTGDDRITPGGGGGVAAYRTYFDTGGKDTIDLNNYVSGAYLHLGTTIVEAPHLVGVSMSMADATTLNSGGDPASLRWFYGEFEIATGSAGGDRIIGNSLDNDIDGGMGADTMAGGIGNDTYVVDQASDVVIENMGEGTDTVVSPFTYNLSANLENITLTGADNSSATGNAANNMMLGNAQANHLSALGGNDYLDGGAGADTLDGGAGDDAYMVENVGDIIVDVSGTDIVHVRIPWVLGTGLESLVLLDAVASSEGNSLGNKIIGNASANAIVGNGGDDTIFGGTGNDTIQGDQNFTAFTGNDIILSEAGDDIVFGGPGDDVVALGAGFDVAIGEAGNDAINGEAGNDAIDGGDGNDTLLGWDDQDILFGSIGDDILFGGNGDDIIMGNRGAPLATIDGVDLVFGDAGQDTIHGGAGDDGINGGDGNDVIDSALGNDNIVGGLGADIMLGSGISPFNSGLFPTGTPGNDQFIYYSAAEGGDSIFGFDLRAGNEDKLFLQPMISAFTWVTVSTLAGLQASEHLRLLDTGSDIGVQVDVDGGGDGFATLVTLIGIANTSDLTSAHFFF